MTAEEKFARLTKALIRNHITASAMESCTAGLFSSLLTDTEGASGIFPGSLVTYSNEEKIAHGVDPEVISRFGVYSVETAEAMARAAAGAFSTDLAVGITGSLGRADPNNSDSVPGEVFFAVVLHGAAYRQKITVPAGSRSEGKRFVCERIADRILEILGKDAE